MAKQKIFYQPDEGFVADIIPFYENGEFKLFYLHDYRDREKHGEGTPWYLVTTKDFTSYKELGEVIPRGSIDEQDLYIFTGSVFKKEDTYHIFYTGHNPHFDVEGKKVQAIMHAVSHDLVHWTKIKEDTFYSEGIEFELHDWRDPFVFEYKGEYKMAITARTKNTHKTRSGVTILYKSDDLVKWTFDEVIWMPSAYYAHECPDIFKINGKWYLIYSEFTDQCLTRYVVSDSLHGPWKALKNDAFDGRAFYAAKSITNDKNERFLFGWNPTKHEENDKNFWHWGGSLEVHKIDADKDGSLNVSLPTSIENMFETELEYDKVIIQSKDKLKSFLVKDKVDESYMLTFKFKTDDAYQIGVMLRHDLKEDFAYAYFMDYAKDKLSFDNLPVEAWSFNNFRNVYRNYRFKTNHEHEVKIIVEKDICICYVDNKIALSSRMYQKGGSGLSLFIKHGDVEFKNVQYKKLKKENEV